MVGNKFNFAVSGVGLSYYVNTINTSNTINGKAIQYLIGEEDLVIDSSWDIGYLGLINCTNVTVKNLTITNNGQGVLLAYSSGSTIKNVNVSSNARGIYLRCSFGNILVDNTATNNLWGIYLHDSSDNALSNNTISMCCDGLTLDNSCGNNVNNNTARGNPACHPSCGIVLANDSSDNTITKNTALSNNYGIRLGPFTTNSDNLIYLNNFADNDKKVFAEEHSTNMWDSLEEITYTYNGKTYTNYLGNYWGDDYSGADPDGDGIGDTPYVIDSDKDGYPLVEPFENYEIGEDTTPPTVSSTSPGEDATGVAIDTAVTATFSEAMDASTITTDSFTLEGSEVSGTVTYNSDTYTATFTPDASLGYDHEYTATLSTAITDVAGNPLAAEYSWSFTTEWASSNPLIAEGTLGGSYGARKLARASDGVLHCVYSRSDGSYYQIYHSCCSGGGQTWTEEQVSAGSNNHREPSIAVDSNDHIHVAWRHCQEPSGGGKTCTVQYRSKTTAWQPIEDVITGYGGWQSIAVDSQNNVHLVVGSTWGGAYNCDYLKYMKRTPSGWSPPETVSSSCWASGPHIAVDENDNVHVLYTHCPKHGPHYGKRYRQRTASGWQDEEVVETDDLSWSGGSLALDSSANVYTVYCNAATNCIKMRKRTPGGWQPTEEIFYPESEYTQRHPVIAIDSNDYLHVVWQGEHSSSPDCYQVRYRKYTTSWSSVEDLTSASVDQETPNLIWSWWPVVDGLRTNRPEQGYAFVWNDGANVRIYKSGDLQFETGTDSTPPTLTTDDATSVEETTATLNGSLTSLGSYSPVYAFLQYGLDTSYGTDTAEQEKTGTGAFTQGITGLSKGTLYHFRAACKYDSNYIYGDDKTLLTKPDEPTGFNADATGASQIDLAWTKGAGAQRTKIQRKEGSYPTDRDDGTNVYFNTGTSESDTGLSPDTTYYYRAWSEVSGSQQWSDAYAEAQATTSTESAPPAPVYFSREWAEKALEWACNANQKGDWVGYCMAFVSDAFKVCQDRPASANALKEDLNDAGDFYAAQNNWDPPRGSLVFFSATGEYAPFGHIGISLGDNKVVHSYDAIREEAITAVETLGLIGSYLGWAYPPEQFFAAQFSTKFEGGDRVFKAAGWNLRHAPSCYGRVVTDSTQLSGMGQIAADAGTTTDINGVRNGGAGCGTHYWWHVEVGETEGWCAEGALNQAPVASFAYLPSEPKSGEWVTFDAGSSDDPDGTIVSYEWDFGDGETAQGDVVCHRFRGTQNESETYNVTLTVEDDNGATETHTVSITVDPLEAIVRVFTRPYVPIGEVTATYNWVETVGGEDIYNVSKIEIKAIAFVGVSEVVVFDDQEVKWSDSTILHPGERYEEPTKTYVAPFGDGFPNGITVSGSDALGLRLGGIDLITLAVASVTEPTNWLMTKVPFLGPILEAFNIDLETILEAVRVDPWKYPVTFAKSSSCQFDPDSAGEPSLPGEELETLLSLILSPGEVRVYDTEGRVTGLVNGEVKEEIPDSAYNDGTVIIMSSSPGSYRYEVEGTGEGSYGLELVSVAEGQTATFIATDIPTSGNASHEYNVDWEALSNGEEGVTLQIDADGDGEFEHSFTADNELTQQEFLDATGTPIESPTGTGTVTIGASGGTMTNLSAVAEATLPTAGKPDVTFPHGLFSFDITNLIAGATTTVYITLPSAMAVGTQYWKCQGGTWVDCTSLLGDDDGDNILALTLTDGGLGDSDGLANGTITDPGGPGVVAAAPTPAPRVGGGNYASVPTHQTMTVNMLGQTTIAKVDLSGHLLEAVMVSDADNRFELALGKGTRIICTNKRAPQRIELKVAGSPPPLPDDAAVVGRVYELNAYTAEYSTTPSQVAISPPASITLAYDTQQLPENTTEVINAYYDEGAGEWVELETAGHVAAGAGLPNTATSRVAHFTPFAVLARLAEATPAKFETSNLTIKPAQAQLGREVTISLHVTNSGGTIGNYSLELTLDGTARATRQITLASEVSQTVTFTITGDGVGKHYVEVAGLTGEFEIKGQQKHGVNLWLVGGVLGILLAVLSLVWLIWTRRRLTG